MRTVTFILLLFSLSLTAQSSLEKESTNIRQLINYGQFEKAYQLSDSLLQSLPNRKNATWIRLLNLNSEALLVINTDQLLVEKQLLEVIQYYESKNDTLNEDLGIAYRNLAMLYSDGIKVRLPAAIKLFNKSNQIMIALFGKESDQYVLWGTSNLANVYLNMGVYDKAEAIYLEGLAIKEKLYGKDHMYYNAAVGHLAMFYRRIGDFKKAEYYELKSLQKEQNWFDQMIGLNNLALTYDNMGEMQKADSVYALCLSIAEGKYGRESYYFMNPYSALGFIQLRLGKYDKAKDILSEVLYTLEELGDTTSKPYMNVLDDLGLLAMEQQKFEEAEAILQKSNKLTHSVFGKNSPLNKRNLRFLSDLYMRKQDFTNAMQYKSSLFQLVTLEIENAFTILSNQEKEQFIPTNIKPYIDNLHAAALRIPNPTYQTLQYDITLATKGLLLKTNNSILQYIYNSSNTLVTANYKKLLDVRRSLAKQYGLPIKDRKEIEQLESEEGLLEKELSKSSSIFRKNQMYDKINATQIRQHLKEQEAAIEFFHFSINRPNATDSVLYAASILLPNSKDIPCLMLFEEEQLRNTLKFKRDATDLNLSEIYASSLNNS